MSPLLRASARLQAALLQEATAARTISLAQLHRLIEEKRLALAELAAAGPPETEEERGAISAMLRTAEENAFVLGAVIGALQGIQERLRQDLSEAANPALYGPLGKAPRRPLRHTLAASLDRTA